MVVVRSLSVVHSDGSSNDTRFRNDLLSNDLSKFRKMSVPLVKHHYAPSHSSNLSLTLVPLGQ